MYVQHLLNTEILLILIFYKLFFNLTQTICVCKKDVDKKRTRAKKKEATTQTMMIMMLSKQHEESITQLVLQSQRWRPSGNPRESGSAISVCETGMPSLAKVMTEWPCEKDNQPVRSIERKKKKSCCAANKRH